MLPLRADMSFDTVNAPGATLTPPDAFRFDAMLSAADDDAAYDAALISRCRMAPYDAASIYFRRRRRLYAAAAITVGAAIDAASTLRYFRFILFSLDGHAVANEGHNTPRPFFTSVTGNTFTPRYAC